MPAKLADRPEQILKRRGYTTSYNSKTKNPNWVAWHLTKDHTYGSNQRSQEVFAEDESVKAPRATDNDYYNSRYDRGHMCPAGDRTYSTSACKATFIMTNVCPQVPSLNRGDWSRDESRTRAFVQGGHHVNIQAHAVFWRADTMWIGRGRVAVPHGFVKTVRLAENDSIIYSRYYPNK